MKLAVFGGAGLAGAPTVRLALEHGHDVRALVRGRGTPGTLDGADVVHGDAFDPDAVAATVAGADAVISTLGGYRGPESIDGGTQNIAAAMRGSGVDRLVVLQGFHIGFPGDQHNPGLRLVEAFLSMRCRPLLGHGRALGELLRRTGDLSWTLVRIPMIAAGPVSGRAQLGTFALGPWSSVRLGDIASTLVRLAEDGTRVREAPMLYTPRRPPRPRG